MVLVEVNMNCILPSLMERVLKLNFFNIIPRTMEKKITAAHLMLH